MHGLMNRAVQCFLTDTYGAALWRSVAESTDLSLSGFESVLVYDDAVTDAVIAAAGTRLDKSRDALLEDLGTYLVSHQNTEALRRLLRFGGENFIEFLHSLDDLPGRARLAVPDFDMPAFELRDLSDGRFRLVCRWHQSGFSFVMMGVLRALADDYGALVFLDHEGESGDEEHISIQLLETEFAQGRSFDLAAGL
ncbi:MAG: heme NO-binding domain-containing protein [Pseudomonadota bacterium]